MLKLIMIVFLLCLTVVVIGEACVIADLQSTLGRYRQSFFEDKTVKSSIMLLPNHRIYYVDFSSL